MTIRTKTLLVIGITFLAMFLVLYLVTAGVLVNSFQSLERKFVFQSIKQGVAILDDDLASLRTTTRDYAAWDRTYSFMKGANPGYPREEYLPENMSGLRVELVAILDNSGRLLFQTAYDLQKVMVVPVPEGILDHFASSSLLLKQEDAKGTTGIILLPQGPMLISVSPILTSKRQGPSLGTLVMGRFLDKLEVKRLAELSDLPMEIQPLPKGAGSESFPLEITPSLLGKTTISVTPLTPESISAKALIPDIYGKPAVLLSLKLPRPIYNQGRKTEYYVLGFLLAAALVLGAAVLFSLERMVFSRVSFLSRSVNTIATQGDVGQRIVPKGKDELATLTANINGMLDTIERAERELQESEARYRDVFETASDFVYTLDLKGNFTSVNAALVDAIGYSHETLMTLNVAQIVAPDHLELLGQMLRKKIEEGTVTAYELDVIKKDGERQTIDVSSRPMFQEGRLIGVHGIARNITKRKELERKTRELSDLKDDLTKMLVHDFKNPMTVISGYLDLMEKRQTDNPEALKWINQMKLAAFAMKQMVSNLLDISRLESATFSLAVEKFSLTRLINEALTETDFIAKNKGVTLHRSLEQDFEMTGDSMVLKRVLTNLVNNAIKYTPSGKNIYVSGESIEKIDLFEGPGVRVVVRDEGEGIMREHLDKIFDKYWTTTTAGKGTGLGLAFCRMAIQSQGGNIWVESEPGQGSTFGFIIPKDLPLKSEKDGNPPSA